MRIGEVVREIEALPAETTDLERRRRVGEPCPSSLGTGLQRLLGRPALGVERSGVGARECPPEGLMAARVRDEFTRLGILSR
jgi:hypothetical protein